MVDELLLRYTGYNGHVDLYENKVKLSHKNNLASKLAVGFIADKEIYLKNISGIQYKPGGLTVGYIQFSFSGGHESKFNHQRDVLYDENSICFMKPQNQEFLELKAKIEEKMALAHSTQATVVEEVSPAADEIRKLAELRDQGILTDEEFQAKKKQLLGL